MLTSLLLFASLARASSCPNETTEGAVGSERYVHYAWGWFRSYGTVTFVETQPALPGTEGHSITLWFTAGGGGQRLPDDHVLEAVFDDGHSVKLKNVTNLDPSLGIRSSVTTSGRYATVYTNLTSNYTMVYNAPIDVRDDFSRHRITELRLVKAEGPVMWATTVPKRKGKKLQAAAACILGTGEVAPS